MLSMEMAKSIIDYNLVDTLYIHNIYNANPSNTFKYTFEIYLFYLKLCNIYF